MSIQEEMPQFESTEQISQQRIERLKMAVETIKQNISPEELTKIDAIIVYGSTALGLAKAESDVDVYITFEPENRPDTETLRVVSGIMEDALPDVAVSFNFGHLVPRGRGTKSITVRSAKHRERTPGWVFVYTKDKEMQTKLDDALVESQHYWDKVGLNQPKQ